MLVIYTHPQTRIPLHISFRGFDFSRQEFQKGLKDSQKYNVKEMKKMRDVIVDSMTFERASIGTPDYN